MINVSTNKTHQVSKQCADCKEYLSVSAFYKRPTGGPRTYCKPCNNKREYKTAKAYQDKYRRTHPEWNRAKHLKAAYNLSLQDFNRLSEKQRHVCAICDLPETRIGRGTKQYLSVDHCHKTGRIRGLLCARCNRALGMFKDSVGLFVRAALYLKRYSNIPKP